MSLVTGEQFTERKIFGAEEGSEQISKCWSSTKLNTQIYYLQLRPFLSSSLSQALIFSACLFFPSNISPHTFFFFTYAETPRTWWNHSMLTPEVSFQLDVVNQRWVSARPINLHLPPLASCSLPFQHGSYFSARPSLLIRQSEFHLSIGDFFNILCPVGLWRRRYMITLLLWGGGAYLFTASCQQDGGLDTPASLPRRFSGSNWTCGWSVMRWLMCLWGKCQLFSFLWQKTTC